MEVDFAVAECRAVEADPTVAERCVAKADIALTERRAVEVDIAIAKLSGAEANIALAERRAVEADITFAECRVVESGIAVAKNCLREIFFAVGKAKPCEGYVGVFRKIDFGEIDIGDGVFFDPGVPGVRALLPKVDGVLSFQDRPFCRVRHGALACWSRESFQKNKNLGQ
ncbi:MAG: hypothetical protein VX168_11625 [Pseudomonadota bacterium]|nr:hypothetical protein [Pseudomonadota bacterium]